MTKKKVEVTREELLEEIARMVVTPPRTRDEFTAKEIAKKGNLSVGQTKFRLDKLQEQGLFQSRTIVENGQVLRVWRKKT